MPQPALHLIVADRALARWDAAGTAPFDHRADGTADAFRLGAVAPDMGLFPGGSATFSSCTHLHRTGELTRCLLRHARTPVQEAFAWGWLTHVLADASIHPIVNHHSLRVGTGTLADHVRVEVGIDVALACDDVALQSRRFHHPLRPADMRFVDSAFDEVYGWRPGMPALMRMQRGMLGFTRLCVHFATVAPTLCWNQPAAAAPPLASALTWRLVSALSGERSTAYAYMNPLRPDADLLAEVGGALQWVEQQLDGFVSLGLDGLPDYDLQTGSAEIADDGIGVFVGPRPAAGIRRHGLPGR
jgi:hypothetical protein